MRQYDYEIYDSHVHIYPDKIAQKATQSIGDFYDIPMCESGTVAQLVKDGQAAGISRFVVHSVATSPKQVSSINAFIWREAAQHPEFIPFFTLHPDQTEEEIAAEVDHCLSLGFYGVKLHPDFQLFALDEDRAQKIFRVVDGRVPILIHTGDYRHHFSNPPQMVYVAKRYQHSIFIGAHFGAWSMWDTAGEWYQGIANMRFDTSSALYALDKQKAADIIHLLGVEKFFFGTDYPMWRPDEELQRFLALPLSEEERRLILAQNLKTLLHL